MMRLGTETGSLVNHLITGKSPVEPKVGMAATICHWTDRSPATVFKVFDFKGNPAVEVREDDYTRVDSNGMSESQDYEYKTRINGSRHLFVRVDGAWREAVYKVLRYDDSGNPVVSKRLSVRKSGLGLVLGRREKYHDFSF